MPLSSPVTAVATESSSGPMGRAAAASMQGVRSSFEDAHLLEQGLGVCGVFDGHLGDEAAGFCAECLHLHLSTRGEPTRDSMLAAFADCDRSLREALPAGSESGTTATVAAVRKNADGTLRVTVANCGDSRAVLWHKDDGSLQATRDHRPNDLEEKKGIEAAGGFVSEEFDPPRVDGQLGCSRALGAFKFKQDEQLEPGSQKVSSVPEIYEWTAKPGDWLLLGCDGVWDVFSSEKVVDEVCKASDADLAAVLSKTLNRCIDKEADDNLTLIAIELGGVPEAPRVADVSPGGYLKVKDKEVLEEYVSFCRRFGFCLTKEMKPKAPPVVCLTPIDPVPGKRFTTTAVALPKACACDSSPTGAEAWRTTTAFSQLAC